MPCAASRQSAASPFLSRNFCLVVGVCRARSVKHRLLRFSVCCYASGQLMDKKRIPQGPFAKLLQANIGLSAATGVACVTFRGGTFTGDLTPDGLLEFPGAVSHLLHDPHSQGMTENPASIRSSRKPVSASDLQAISVEVAVIVVRRVPQASRWNCTAIQDPVNLRPGIETRAQSREASGLRTNGEAHARGPAVGMAMSSSSQKFERFLIVDSFVRSR